MIGDKYWCSGITISWSRNGADDWFVCLWLNFYDNGFCEDDSTEGSLRLRYGVKDISAGLDTLISDAQGLGIVFENKVFDRPCLYESQDGEGSNPRPGNWVEIIEGEAVRLGWHNVYKRLPRRSDSP